MFVTSTHDFGSFLYICCLIFKPFVYLCLRGVGTWYVCFLPLVLLAAVSKLLVKIPIIETLNFHSIKFDFFISYSLILRAGLDGLDARFLVSERGPPSSS